MFSNFRAVLHVNNSLICQLLLGLVTHYHDLDLCDSVLCIVILYIFFHLAIASYLAIFLAVNLNYCSVFLQFINNL